MAKEKSPEKKVKKEKHASKDGVHKSKKDKSSGSPVDADAAEILLKQLENGTEGRADITVPVVLRGALVPFANPIADDKTSKKVLKGVKKAARARSLKRGVKEVVKSLRKSAIVNNASTPHSVVILAADISPMDVISHIPVLCEDHGVPYIYVTSRAELGAAGLTRRPTSVVLVGKEAAARKVKAAKGEDGEEKSEEEIKAEWNEAYGDLVKAVKKAGKDVKV